jgi:hypothetical protein
MASLPEKTQPFQNEVAYDQNGQDEKKTLLGFPVEIGFSIQMVESLLLGVAVLYGLSSVFLTEMAALPPPPPILPRPRLRRDLRLGGGLAGKAWGRGV